MLYLLVLAAVAACGVSYEWRGDYSNNSGHGGNDGGYERNTGVLGVTIPVCFLGVISVVGTAS